MTGWTLFLTIVGVAFLTAQLFRLIDLIERPTRRPAGKHRLPEPWLSRAVPAVLSCQAAVLLAIRQREKRTRSPRRP